MNQFQIERSLKNRLHCVRHGWQGRWPYRTGQPNNDCPSTIDQHNIREKNILVPTDKNENVTIIISGNLAYLQLGIQSMVVLNIVEYKLSL